jgi:hypothetical protein
MKKIDLGQSLAVAANVGVIVGIIFLAIEVRQASDAVRTNNAQSSIELGMQIGDWLRDAEFANTYLDVQEGADLTNVQRIQFDEFMGQRMNIWEFAFNAHETGTMSDVDWMSWDTWFSNWIREKGVRDFWEMDKRSDYSGAGEFLRHVDSVLAND